MDIQPEIRPFVHFVRPSVCVFVHFVRLLCPLPLCPLIIIHAGLVLFVACHCVVYSRVRFCVCVFVCLCPRDCCSACVAEYLCGDQFCRRRLSTDVMNGVTDVDSLDDEVRRKGAGGRGKDGRGRNRRKRRYGENEEEKEEEKARGEGRRNGGREGTGVGR